MTIVAVAHGLDLVTFLMALAAFGGPRLGSLSGVSYCLIGPFQALYHGLASRYWKAPPLTGTVS